MSFTQKIEVSNLAFYRCVVVSVSLASQVNNVGNLPLPQKRKFTLICKFARKILTHFSLTHIMCHAPSFNICPWLSDNVLFFATCYYLKNLFLFSNNPIHKISSKKHINEVDILLVRQPVNYYQKHRDI